MEQEQNKAKLSTYHQEHDESFLKSGFSTKCLHMGQEPEYIYGSMCPAIHLSSTYAQISPGVPFSNFDYTRCGNPTRSNLERLISGIESAKYSHVWSSGMAAINAMVNLLEIGDEIVCVDDVYGGTQRYLRNISSTKQGIKYTFIDFDDMELLKKSLHSGVKMVMCESETNPTLKVADIKTIIKIVKDYNPEIITVIDNTFISPYNCRPIELGVDIVMESVTKYINGHSDVLMGITATNCEKLHDKLFYINRCVGAVPSPFDCFMTIRGIKTLSIRIERQNSNALAIARFLESNKNIEKVCYPGLESSKYHKAAKEQFEGFGGIVSFYVKGEFDYTKKFLEKLGVITLAESLGSVETLINHPETMTHGSVPKEMKEKLGITPNFLRLSVGVEDIDDLVKDLEQALLV